VVPLAESAPDVVKRALRLKKLANDICEKTNGHAVHGMRMVPGWVTMLPTAQELKDLKQRLQDAVKDIEETIETIKSVADKIPPLERETEYISLRSKNDFAFYDGDIYSSDTGATPVDNYRKMTNEKVVKHSTGKHTHASRDSYMVGALARCNNNADRLNETGQKAAGEFGFKPICTNPYFNSVAQVIECGHNVQHAIETIDALVGEGLKQEKKPDIKPKAGRGVGSTEVPRGILYHDYTYDDGGCITEANCIIPTNQNFANIDNDMREFVPKMIEQGWDKDKIVMGLEMLVRAYDPCISCSVHNLDVKFVE
ncbi:MAG: nickel-dependent hydrogenase large subunit, partial [Spirochaetota bacterium]